MTVTQSEDVVKYCLENPGIKYKELYILFSDVKKETIAYWVRSYNKRIIRDNLKKEKIIITSCQGQKDRETKII